ncbi:MAG: hypothetical protein IIZ83_00915 [Oscillospiraceae bacterium]|nr:hypothetical protein [Oscillospiraceae bacterium]
MIENAEKFFELYKTDEALRARVKEAMDCYPGSFEIREPLVEEVLLPIAHELGLDFTVSELRAYETRKKLSHLHQSDEEYFASIEDEEGFWLLDNGWEYDEDVLRAGEEWKE